MRKKKLNTQYNGALTAKQVADGMNAARENALRLYEDAKSLFDARRFPSACALAVLSIEEAGKLAILRRMSGVTDGTKLKALWREYRTYTAKNRMWIIRDLALSDARTIGDMKKIATRTPTIPSCSIM